MVDVTKTIEGVTAAFNRDAAVARTHGEPEWLRERRLAAWRVYEETPLPTTKLEEWRYTEVSKLSLEDVHLAEPDAAADAAPARALLEGLRAVVKRFIDEGAKANLKRWNYAVEMTAARAGMVLCGDLDICRKVLSSEQTRPGEPTAAEKMQSLLAYSVSEDYTRVREALGVVVPTV